MFNEFQQEMIATIAIVFILVFYFMLKRSSIPQTHSDTSEKNDTAQAVVQETIEKKAPEVLVQTPEEKPTDTISRRKTDNTIQKRSVPENATITKQSFCEFAGERILVAEDNHINQKVIMGLLAESGIELVMANDGQEALDILINDTDFVMILMDANMPRVDGFEATRMIRENPRYDHIVVVALSGDTATDDIQRMKNAGMSEQLAKPLRMDSLYKIIYAYTGKKTHKNESAKIVIMNNLDTKKGLYTCGGDDAFYREILAEFMRDYSDSSHRLGELLRSNNIQLADVLLLDIIGVAKNIGAHPLAKSASDMKLALRDTQEQSYFSLFDQYKVHLDRLMQDIRKYL
jgi:CheY-like chemotaxis protein/HPt (histidine-containing phosphotransfer) domain-containing protein